jgi:diguanylate cyclase (GGDEF)-like protein
VILVDVDRFKRVNDTYGHAAGDELLAVTAARLRAWADRVGGGACGRLGGDEFTAITRRAVTDAETADLAACSPGRHRCPAPASPSP